VVLDALSKLTQDVADIHIINNIYYEVDYSLNEK